MAFEAGVDVFMTKPVRFKEVGKILEGWIKSREVESKALEVVTQKREKGRADSGTDART